MEDERLAKIEQEKQNALSQSNSVYDGLLNDNQSLFDKQNQYATEYEKTQNEALDKQLAFNQAEIERQKEIARQNKEIEAKKAQNDYAAFINPYGINAETQASQGLGQSGLSETSKLGGWNTYQNRLATANKAMQDAFVQYDRDMNEARLNNDVQKAQNALARLQMQLEYSQSFYNNKSQLTQNQLSYNQSLDNDYFNRYQTEYGNIQNELAQKEAIRQWEAQMAEQKRQYDENMAWQKEQARIQQEQWQKEYALSRYQSRNNAYSGNGESLSDTPVNNNNTTSQTNNENSRNNHNINGSEIISGPYQTVSSFIGSTGNVGTNGSNIDNQEVYPTADGRFYTWDEKSGQYIDITSYKKKKISSHNVGNVSDNSFLGSLYKNTLGRLF